MLKYIIYGVSIIFISSCSKLSIYKITYDITPKGGRIFCASLKDIIDKKSKELKYILQEENPSITIESEQFYSDIKKNNRQVALFLLNDMNICYVRWYSGISSYTLNLNKYHTLQESFKSFAYKKSDKEIKEIVSKLKKILTYKEIEYMKYYIELPPPMERYDDGKNYDISFIYPQRAYRRASYQKDLDYEMQLKAQKKK